FVPTTITCPSNKNLTSTSPNCTKIVNGLKWTGLTGSCTSLSVTYNITGASTYSGVGDASGLVFNQGISTVTYTVRDDCGNVETCSFDVKLNCICDCPNNLLKNPGFHEGAMTGDLNNMGESDHWDVGTRTPQISDADSCCDEYMIQMWGILQNTNLYSYTGEAIYQQGLSFLAGHHYKISFCARYLPSQPIAHHVNFGFTASNGWVNPFLPCGNCDDIGSSPQIYSSAWMTYTLPIWTPTQNWSRLNIRVYSGQGIQTWGLIDNICVEEVPYTCCSDQQRFSENIQNAVNITFDQRTEEIVFTTGDLPECDSIAYVDWGNGNITEGPFGGNEERRQKILNHLFARVEYKAQEFDQSEPIHEVCLETIQSDSIEAALSSTKYLMLQKKCGKIGEVSKKIEWTSRIACIDRGGRSEVSSSRYHLETAVLKPVAYDDPIVKITHTRGFTVVATQAGEEIALLPNENISAKIQLLYPAPEGYEWFGLQSNLLTPTSSPELDSLEFIISFSFLNIPEGSEDSTGAVWISDDKDDLYGEYILDGFAYFDTAVKTFSTEYGLRPKIVCKLLTVNNPPPPHWVLHWHWDLWSKDSGGRDSTDALYQMETAVLKANVLPAPAVSLTDSLGHPLLTDAGEEITLTPDMSISAKIQRLYPAPLGYSWFGLVSNRITPSFSEFVDSMKITLTATWVEVPDGAEDSTGAFWFSDNKEDLYGEFITDGFTLLGAATVDTATSTDPIFDSGKIKLYPNPASGELTIDCGDPDIKGILISISNALGQSMPSGKVIQNNNLLILNVIDLTDGMYFIKVLIAGRPMRILRFLKA
ncbi:MAG: T9SS type A sorting domain-containing protein, partial [Saprospiraceae bacterium]